MEISQTNDIRLFNLLREKLGEAETGELIKFVKNEVKENVMLKTDHLATKADLSKTQTRLILWSFAFWVTQFTALGMLLLMIYNNIRN